MANTTWNASDKTASVTLSNLNLTAACGGGSGVRGVDGQVSGKYYFEVTATTWTGVQPIIGIANTYAPLATIGSTPTGCACIASNSGLIFINGSNTSITAIPSPANGMVISVAVDLDNKLIWFRTAPSGNWNGNATYAPGGTGGVSFAVIGVGGAVPAFPVVGGAFASSNYTANFGDLAFSGAVPAGFTAGWPTSTLSTSAIVTQTALEQWQLPVPAAQVTQVSFEQWQAPIPRLQVTQVGAEEWVLPNPLLQVTQVAVEEWVVTAIPQGEGWLWVLT